MAADWCSHLLCRFFAETENVSVGNGAELEWSPDGRTLYFRNGNQLLAADVLDADSITLGVPRPLQLCHGLYRS